VSVVKSPETTLRARSDLLARKLLRQGWLLVAFGLLVPPVALVGALYGVAAIRQGRRSGWTLCLVSISVFTARLVLWLG